MQLEDALVPVLTNLILRILRREEVRENCRWESASFDEWFVLGALPLLDRRYRHFFQMNTSSRAILACHLVDRPQQDAADIPPAGQVEVLEAREVVQACELLQSKDLGSCLFYLLVFEK